MQEIENKLIIGRKEKVDFPDLKRQHVVARIDSGAKSSAAHCDKIWTEQRNGRTIVCCHFLKRSRKVTRFAKFRRRKIRSSNGQIETRYSVKLNVKLGNIVKRTDVTLTDRSTMNYTVLLGRRFLQNDFLIDVSRNYVQSEKTE